MDKPVSPPLFADKEKGQVFRRCLSHWGAVETAQKLFEQRWPLAFPVMVIRAGNEISYGVVSTKYREGAIPY